MYRCDMHMCVVIQALFLGPAHLPDSKGGVFAHELHRCFLLSGEFVPSSAIEFGARNAIEFLAFELIGGVRSAPAP